MRGVGFFCGREVPGRGVGDGSKSLISAGEYVGSFAPVVLSVAAGRDELSVSERCCFVSLPKCPSLLSEQTHDHQSAWSSATLCTPTLSHQGGHSGFWSFPLLKLEAEVV